MSLAIFIMYVDSELTVTSWYLVLGLPWLYDCSRAAKHPSVCQDDTAVPPRHVSGANCVPPPGQDPLGRGGRSRCPGSALQIQLSRSRPVGIQPAFACLLDYKPPTTHICRMYPLVSFTYLCRQLLRRFQAPASVLFSTY